ALAAASSATRYSPAPAITTPMVSGPHLSSQGLSPPLITRPTLSVPPVNTPGITAQSYTFPVQIPAGARPEAAAPEPNAPPPPPNPIKLFTGSDIDPDEVDFLWGKHDRLAEQRVYSRSPLLWRLFEQELIRLEQMMQSGDAYRGRIEKQLGGLHRLAATLGRPTTIDPVPAFSLPLAIRYNQVPDSPANVRQMAAYLGAKSAEGPAGPNGFIGPMRPSAARPSRDAVRGGGGADQTTADGAGADVKVSAQAGDNAGGDASVKANVEVKGADSGNAGGPSLQPAAGSDAPTVNVSVEAGPTPAADPQAPAADPKAGAKPAPTAPAPPPAPTMPEGPNSYAGRAIAAWYRFLEPVSGDSAPPEINELLNFVGPPDVGLDPGFVEMHFLQMLSRHLDGRPDRRPKFEYLQRAGVCRDVAEQAALPADLRTHYWVRPLIDQGDGARRLAEDKLFIGSTLELRSARTLWEEAETRYVEGSQQGVLAAEAFAVRDRAWAELPYLAEWFARRMSPYRANEGAAWDEKLNNLLLPTIAAAHALGAAIENNLSSTDLAPLSAKAAEVKKGCDDLKRIFEDHWEGVLSRSPRNEVTLHEILSLLRSPLIPAAQRRELRYVAAQIALKLHHDVDTSPLSATSPSIDDGKPPLKYLERQLAWDAHPALAILSRETFALERLVPQTFGAPGDSDEFTEQLIDSAQRGEEIRLSLGSLWPTVDAWLSSSDVVLKADSQSELEARRLRGSAERLLRTAAVLSLDKPRRDPTTAVQELDLHNLMTWCADRTLRDFWGPVQPQGESYFASAGSKYLNAATAFIAGGSDLRVGGDRKLWDDLKRLERASLVGVRAQTKNLFRADASKERDIDVAIAPGLPEGQAALWLFDPQSGSLAVRSPDFRDVVRFPLSIDGEFSPGQRQSRREEVPFYFNLDAMENAGPRLEVGSLYRGHFFANPFLLESHNGVAVEYAPPPPEPARLTVFGSARQGGSVMFVLDCSMSMNERTPVESPEENGGEPAEEVRLTLAKRALRELLDRLAVEDDYKVGVEFYGHRVGYNLANKDEVLTQPDYEAARIPRDLLPAEDVEMIWPLGRYDQTHNGVTNRLLDQLQPWGETPLYLSIVKGLEQFGKDDPGRRQSLVVITDGLDNVWQPANSSTPKTTKADVLALLRRRQVPIYILGFDIAAPDKARAQRDFTELAQASGGQYFEVNDAATLGQALSRSLGPGVFSLDVHGMVAGPGRNQPFAQALLGEPVELPVRPGRREDFDVRLQVGEVRAETEVELIGGEAVEIYWNDSRKRLEFRRYLKGNPRFSAPTPDDSTAERRYILGAHAPSWNGPQLTFPVSFQNANETAFSPAPAEVWVEITPMLPQGPGAPLVFYDLNLEPGKPAPVLACRANGWPLDAHKARVHAWWKYRTTQPDQVMSVGDATASKAPGE
ncbi:MAG TPA: vWA domain-containing protein, partial [Pirellulales bacterium]